MSQHRTRKLKNIALSMGMSFEEKDKWKLFDLIHDFKLFKKGFRKRISNVISLDDGLEEFKIRMFDYHYVISTGNSSRRFKQSVFFIQSKELGLPEFWMQPESFLHKIGNLIGFEDINFESHPEFSQQYRLRGKDEELVRHTFKKEVLHYFTFQKGWRLEGLGYYFILYQKNVLWNPHEIHNLYQQGLKIWKNLK